LEIQPSPGNMYLGPERREIEGCPVHAKKYLYIKDSELIICTAPGCEWTLTKKRTEDMHLPDYDEYIEAKREFNGG
jgi:hypothetical protein